MSRRGGRNTKPEDSREAPDVSPSALDPTPAPSNEPHDKEIQVQSPVTSGRLRSLKPGFVSESGQAESKSSISSQPRFAPNVKAAKPLPQITKEAPVVVAPPPTSPSFPATPKSTTPLAPPRSVPKSRPSLAATGASQPPSPGPRLPSFHANDFAPQQADSKDVVDHRNAHHPMSLPFPPSELLKHQSQTGAAGHRIDDVDHPAFLFEDYNKEYIGHNEIFYVQLPSRLPLPTPPARPAAVPPLKGQVKEDAMDLDEPVEKGQPYPAQEQFIPPGRIGSLRIRQSGKVELVIGDSVFDVTQGYPLSFLQELVVLNDRDQIFQSLGPLTKRLVVNPNITSLLEQEAIAKNDPSEREHGDLIH